MSKAKGTKKGQMFLLNTPFSSRIGVERIKIGLNLTGMLLDFHSNHVGCSKNNIRMQLDKVVPHKNYNGKL